MLAVLTLLSNDVANGYKTRRMSVILRTISGIAGLYRTDQASFYSLVSANRAGHSYLTSRVVQDVALQPRKFGELL
jgi:hypothetical protein